MFQSARGDRGICSSTLEHLLEQQPTTDDRIADNQATLSEFKFAFRSMMGKRLK